MPTPLARALGKEQETSYRNSMGEIVRWKFKGLGQLEELTSKSIRSGTEIYSRLSRKEKPWIPQKHGLLVFWKKRSMHKTGDELLLP